MAAPALWGQQQRGAGAATKFQIGCMTITYSEFPFERALRGIAGAGYRYVGWGTTHRGPTGSQALLIAPEAPATEARRLARVCIDHGLTPVMMFSMIYVEAPESVKVHTRRIEQAAAAGIPFIITFGKVEKSGPGELSTWVRNLKQLGPVARNNGVTLAIKQHGGQTATGRDCSRIIQAVADEGVKMCYDAGNVLDYQNADPIPDIQACWSDVRAFAIKDHRNTPKDEDCGPGFGEIDHYKLLLPLLNTGLTIPLVCENIFEPLVSRPKTAEALDELARRAREFLETVTTGLQQAGV
jgi:sugar phosphate isomerase/epimerase